MGGGEGHGLCRGSWVMERVMGGGQVMTGGVGHVWGWGVMDGGSWLVTEVIGGGGGHGW